MATMFIMVNRGHGVHSGKQGPGCSQWWAGPTVFTVVSRAYNGHCGWASGFYLVIRFLSVTDSVVTVLGLTRPQKGSGSLPSSRFCCVSSVLHVPLWKQKRVKGLCFVIFRVLGFYSSFCLLWLLTFPTYYCTLLPTEWHADLGRHPAWGRFGFLALCT